MSTRYHSVNGEAISEYTSGIGYVGYMTDALGSVVGTRQLKRRCRQPVPLQTLRRPALQDGHRIRPEAPMGRQFRLSPNRESPLGRLRQG